MATSLKARVGQLQTQQICPVDATAHRFGGPPICIVFQELYHHAHQTSTIDIDSFLWYAQKGQAFPS